eukprot:SAG31_NODE_3180_length_4582_cov_2.985501_4_plen_57_part_00
MAGADGMGHYSTQGKGCYFLVFVQLLYKCGTLIERYTALIEKVSLCIDPTAFASGE